MAYILIADDDDFIAELASDILLDAGHACGWVTNAEEAWQVMQHKRPDILLLDQDMPGMSGVTFLRQLRSSAYLYDLPVIMFTAMRGDADERRAIYAGAQDYLRKPFERTALVRKIDNLLADRAARPQHVDLKTWLAESSGQANDDEQYARRRFV